MNGIRTRLAVAVLTAGLGLGASGLQGATFSFAGTFTQDDNPQQIFFTLGSPGTVTVRSFGFAGGTNAAATLIAAGGFDTTVQVFDAAGNLVALNDDGACAQTATDPASGYCMDAFLATPLPAGSYTLVLTQHENSAMGPTLADGFLHTGEGNFTGPSFLGSAGSFVLVNGAQRTGAWALDLLGVDTASLGPVPVELMRFDAR